MSWSKVIKINNDLTTPINLLNLINHIDLIGTEYNAYYNFETAMQLMRTNGIYSHNIALETVSNKYWQEVLNMSSNVGNVLTASFGLNISGLNAIDTITQLSTNNAIRDAVFSTYKVATSIMYTGNSTVVDALASNRAVFGLKNSIYGYELLIQRKNEAYTIVLNNTGYSDLLNGMIKFESNGTFTMPANKNHALAISIGGGNYGNSAQANQSGTVEGGNSGGYSHAVIYLNPLATTSVVVGSGGIPRQTTGGTNIPATNSSINGVVGVGAGGTAYGGSNGGDSSANGGTPIQFDKLIRVSNGGYSGGFGNGKPSGSGGGGGGFGGGNGGNSAFLNGIMGSGGIGEGSLGTGGFGNAGGNYRTNDEAGGGGGGYGGGGGGGRDSYSNTFIQGGNGGQGIVVVII